MILDNRSGVLGMILHILKALFILLMGAIGWFYLQSPSQFWGEFTWLTMAVSLIASVFIVCVDILSPRSKLAIFSGTAFGLIVGVFLAYALSYVVRLLVEQFMPLATIPDPLLLAFQARRESLTQFINLLVGVSCCYLSISFILQTKDDFRFVIPYVEFSKQTKGARPILVDTSVLIDGRIADMALTGIFESQLVVPRFLLEELQQVADSPDKLKRNRGRRGLDVLAELQDIHGVEVVLIEADGRRGEDEPVDVRIMNVADELSARVLTNDFALNKVARLRGVDVININDLANALKPSVLPGEKMVVKLIRAGEDAGQGVGFLEDGTMVVVEQGRKHLDEDVEFVVTNTRQTSAGKMIFGRIGEAPPNRKSRPRIDPTTATST